LDNLKICLLLHFYQPWWQFLAVLEKIVNQCYRPLLEIIRNSENFCFTLNVNAVLLELLEQHGFHDVVSGFREAAKAGKIELVGSTYQHPIFPLIPEKVKRAQIEEDQHIKESRFSIKRNCKGFFLPEMAFHRRDISLLRSYSYRWSVMDDVPFTAINNYAPFDHIILLNGFKMYMRSGYWSNIISSGRYSFSDIKSMIEYEVPNWTKNAPAYVILAMDAETFGHHHEHLIDSFLRPMLAEWSDKIVSVESLGRSFPPRNVNYLPDGSWSTSADDIRKSDPYPLWDSHFNRHHSDLWELVNLALDYFEQCREDCLKLTSSCHWWWISGRPDWNPEFMKYCARGRKDLGVRGAIDIVRKFSSDEEKIRAEELYNDLIRLN